jgi:hypothetical protein
MDLVLLRTFQQHVLSQCKFAIRAAGEVDAGLDNNDRDRIFYSLQSLLNATANVAKALWGPCKKPDIAARRKPLRDSIGVTDDSPLRSVKMRNNFEHFDERIDKWWKNSTTHNSIDYNIATRGGIQADTDPLDWFRNFDPQTTQLYFWGQELNMRELVDEIQRIVPKLQEEANKPPWNP